MLRLNQALLLIQSLVGEIPLQPFRCILQGRLNLLRRSDNLHGCGQIASGAVRVAIAAGEGKAHGARGPSARRSVDPFEPVKVAGTQITLWLQSVFR